MNKSFLKFITDFGPLLIFFTIYYKNDNNLIVAIPPLIIATIVAVVIGFIGMLMIVKPAYEELNIYYLFPIIFCIFFACVALSIRSLSSTEPNYRIALYFSILSMIVGLATLPFGWIMPSKFELFLLIFTGIIGSVANILLTVSLRIAEASLVTPTKYLNLVFAILLGYFIWGEIPKVLTLLGAGLIIVSSAIIFMRESQLKKQVVSPRP